MQLLVLFRMDFIHGVYICAHAVYIHAHGVYIRARGVYTVRVIKKFKKNGLFRLRCVVLAFSGNDAKWSVRPALHGVSVFRKRCKTVCPFRSAVCSVLKSHYTA